MNCFELDKLNFKFTRTKVRTHQPWTLNPFKLLQKDRTSNMFGQKQAKSRKTELRTLPYPYSFTKAKTELWTHPNAPKILNSKSTNWAWPNTNFDDFTNLEHSANLGGQIWKIFKIYTYRWTIFFCASFWLKISPMCTSVMLWNSLKNQQTKKGLCFLHTAKMHNAQPKRSH